jgi:hypothetical protein
LRADRDDQRPVGLESEVAVCQRGQGADEQSRADEQHERQRNLRHHQGAREPDAPSGRRPSSVLLHRVDRCNASSSKRRNDAEEQRGADGDHRGESKHPPVDADIEEYPIRCRRELPDNEATPPPRDDNAEHGAEAGEHQALGEQLSREPRRGRPQCGAHAQLVPAGGGAGKLKVGDVSACDEEHQSHDRDKSHDRALILVAQIRDPCGRGVKRQRVGEMASGLLRTQVGGARLVRDPRLHRTENLGRLVGALTGSQAHHHIEPPARPAIELARTAADQRMQSERHGDVVGAADIRAEERGRSDADDRDRNSVQRDATSDDIAGAEPALPESVTDDGNRAIRSAAPTVIHLRKGASHRRRHAERLEHPPARPEAVHGIALPGAREVEPGVAGREGCVEQLPPVPDRLPDGIGPRLRAIGVDEHRETLGMLHRERAKHERVDDGEHGRVRADAEPKREDSDGRDEGRDAQGAYGIAEVGHSVARGMGISMRWDHPVFGLCRWQPDRAKSPIAAELSRGHLDPHLPLSGIS